MSRLPLSVRWRARATQWFLERVLRAPRDITFVLGGGQRPFAPYVRIETRQLWAAEPRARKLQAVFRRRWRPDEEIMNAQALAAYRTFYFGGDEDCGDDLGRLVDWHLAREWELDALTEGDRVRAEALAVFTLQTRLRYQDTIAAPATVQLGTRTPAIADLVHPVVAKMPVLSLQYFLELHAHYAFDAVRRANHPHADEIIAFLYELLFVQQKVATGLLNFVQQLAYADTHKADAQLLHAEVDAIMTADGLFANLKASVEKTIALVGLTHGIPNLDAKKDHKARVRTLRDKVPNVEDRFYAEFLFEMVGSEHLEDLNSYRTGLLHKRGIADLQPHNYVGQPAGAVPLRRVLAVTHEQHSKNTALLLVALALLTDDLVRRDPPPFAVTDIPGGVERIKARTQDAASRAEAAITEAIASARVAGAAEELGRLYAARGGARRQLGRTRDALADFRAALKHGVPDPEDVHVNVGAALMDLDDDGKDAASVEAFTQAIALAPDMNRAYCGRALAYENLGNLEAAVADFDVVIPRVQQPAELHETRGRWRLTLGRYADALADFDAAKALGHEPPEVLTGRGVALRGLGAREESLAALTVAVERHPTAVVARMQRASTLLEAGELGAARADLDYVIEHHTDHWKIPDALSMRATLRALEGDDAGAVADLEAAIVRSPGSVPAEWVSFVAALRSNTPSDANRA